MRTKALAFRYFDQRWNHNNDAVIDELLDEGMSLEDEKAHLKGHAAFVISSSPSMA